MSERVNGLKYMIYYDADVDGRLYPLWYIAEGPIDWNKSATFFSIHQSFVRVNSIDLDDGVLGCSVHVGEMIINEHKPGQFGVNLKALRARIEPFADLKNIRRLIFQIADIENVLSIGKKRFAW